MCCCKVPERTSKIPVLVIDNANRLPGPMLAQFQDFAKEAADRGIAKAVFVTNEGRVPRQRSAWSRNQGILEIGDISQDEAFDYMKRRNVDPEQAMSIYALVGGRMVSLEFTENNLDREVQLDGLYSKLLGRFHKQGKALIAKLLEDGVISYDAYVEIAGNEEIADEMLQENLFSYHLHAGTVTFKSTPIQQYCHANWSKLFESK
ncbi:hypothetical protein V8E54_008387 [Elaphomyces granulatus]